MAERAGSRRTVEIPGASHVVGVSQPEGPPRSSSRPRGADPAAPTQRQRSSIAPCPPPLQLPVVLEQASQEFVEATAKPPFLYELTPPEARKVLDDVQAAPIDKLPVEDQWVTVPAAVGDVAACASSGPPAPSARCP